MSRVLRPHHGMCFQFYEGKGYSEDFTDHMGRIIREMESDPSQKIRLKVETDIVCRNCPNNEAGECTTADKVKRYDEEVLKACGLVEGDEISFAEFTELVREKIIDAGIRSDICGDCSWDYICREKERILRAVRRIFKMESILDEALRRMDDAEEAPQEFLDYQTEIKKLDEYYSSQDWKNDYVMDEDGLLPKDLKRGVLSEDGIYDALERNKELMERIKGTRMVKHVILWTLKDELSAEEKVTIKQEIKEGLEGLKGKVPGIVDIKVNINGLESSNADLMLDSTFESIEALKGYSVHPEHVAVADSKVRPYTKIRSCLDFEV
ncbi:hypothetical protein SAMN02910398_02446 [Butyrivibrio sp. YAB3001]|nr:DUF1284 domain-containing protein [Butyrivibrio sp. YAB3001]SFC50868.1 hypothetical protein SAMN02910398_02446 [Butyrivibrio sp. YAB3001]